MSAPRPIEGHSVVLLVVAHPDDEVMFFSPMLERMSSKRMDLHLLSLSTGNADGLGSLRRVEFLQCAKVFGINPSNVEIIDHPALQDGMRNVWSDEVISSIVKEKISHSRVDLIITFDEFGVSGHPNHIAVYHGVKRALRAMASKGAQVDGIKLLSKNLVRKFSGPFDIIVAYFLSEYFVYKLNPMTTIFGMFAHASQFVWYRRLFVLFSCYTYINSFASMMEN